MATSKSPIITFKAGICDVDTSVTPPKVKAKATPGYLYLFEEDELMHFCWRPRSESMSRPELELVMVPSDGRFVPYTCPPTSDSSSSGIRSPTNGRIFVLKFQSSTQRHFFWLQSKSQHPQGDMAWFSPKDLKLGDIVDRLLQGDQVDARQEYNSARNDGEGGEGDAEMEDAPGGEGPATSGGGSGDPFTAHQQSEGGQSRGGGNGGPAPTDDATAAVQSFLRSMQGSSALKNAPTATQIPRGQIYTTLPDLLPTATTIPVINSANSTLVDKLLSNIPPVLLLLSQQRAQEVSTAEPNSETTKAALEAMSLEQKKEILRKVLRSPQFAQSLESLTTALREGGLPTISDALRIPVPNGGLIPGGSMPLGGGDAVAAFVKGFKNAAESEKESMDPENMETD